MNIEYTVHQFWLQPYYDSLPHEFPLGEELDCLLHHLGLAKSTQKKRKKRDNLGMFEENPEANFDGYSLKQTLQQKI